MATIRSLKKDVDFLANDIIATLCVKNSITADKAEKTSELIVKAAAYKRNYINKINAYDPERGKRVKLRTPEFNKGKKKATRTYFVGLKKDLFDDFKKLVAEVNAY